MPAEVCVEWECCWAKNEIAPGECPYIAEGEEELYSTIKRRVVEKCLECPRFRTDLLRLREQGHPLADVLPFIADEFVDQKARLQSMGSFLTSKTREIRFLHELNLVLQTSLDLDEILSVAMTAITAGKGFGMNRAFLLMADKERQFLRGYLGVGPRNYDEACQIWREIGQNDLTLREMARNFQKTKLASEKIKFHDILEQLSIPLANHKHIFSRTLRERKAVLVRDAFHNPEVDPELAGLLGVDSFLIMPLISRNRRVGLILADNCITHKPITTHDIQLMETFAFPVAFALERASLYERLHEEVEKLTAANAKLKEQQELIVKMEKMALVGRITSSIAHSIRNPLMIIGGFARSLLKTIAESDRNRQYLESIVREAKQLEDVLEEVLSYADSLYPAMDTWDINQLVTGVFDKFRERLVQKEISCVLAPAAALPMVFIDYKQVAFCFRTILNTIMETPGVDRIGLTTWLAGDDVVIEIRDNGTAPPREYGEEPGAPASVAQELGRNLGLPLCRAIIEKYGNPFVIEALPDRGTKYTIRLPIRKEGDSNGADTGRG
ncbi:MAG: GAF domain-containing protein [Geobacteraceae bacterium]|nr:GAF domain-containing protein [Geobacteraceae bacterium]